MFAPGIGAEPLISHMRTQVCHSTVEFIDRPFEQPLQLSTGTITEISEARVSVTVNCEGTEATGKGSIYLSDLWAWPDPALDHMQKDATLRDLTGSIAEQITELCGSGRDNSEDLERTAEVYRFARRHGVRKPRIAVDSNEGNPSAESVLDYLERLREADRDAFNALEYLEQPTGRDIVKDAFDWRSVSKLKPILLDEGLTQLDLLPECRRQGWGGLALKTCKGHSFALTAAAWARENDFLFSLQDLTNPGLSLIHAALLASHIHPINGVELNSPQFTPKANKDWMPRLQSLFEPRDGYHRLPGTVPPGLGSVW